MNIGEAAAELGLPVFPCDSRNHPIVAGGFKAASSDPQVIADAFRKPGAERIGVPTGLASGFVVIDVDVKNGRDGTQWLEANTARLPATRTHRTVSGGLHLLFRNPEAVELRNSAGKIAPGIDVRANGGYIVAPPSPGYSVVKDLPPAEMPDWLVQLCAPAPPPVPPLQVVQRSNGNGDTGRYAETALENEVHIVEAALEGTRNHTLNVAAVKLGGLVAGGLLSRGDVEAALLAAALSIGLTQHEARATIKSGLDFGARQPRSPPPRDERRTNGHDFGPPPEPDDPGYFASLEADTIRGDTRDTADTPAPQPNIPLLLSEPDFCASLRPPFYVVDGIIQRGFLYCCTSLTGHGKTAVAMMLAYYTALGRKLGPIETYKGKVVYLAGENPDDLKVRCFACRGQYGITGAEDVRFLPSTFPLTAETMEGIMGQLARVENLVLVIIDTAAAYFPGEDENANVEMGAYARTLRKLTELPDKPAVLVLSHPTKAAAKDNLLPRGGGAFLNEVDGNLTLWKSDEETTSLHWQGKIRGPDFEAVSFRLKPVILDDTRDGHGRPMRSVVAIHKDVEEVERSEQGRISEENVVLELLRRYPGISVRNIADHAGWRSDIGSLNIGKVQRLLKELEKYKLARIYRGKWQITDRGTEELDKLS